MFIQIFHILNQIFLHWFLGHSGYMTEASNKAYINIDTLLDHWFKLIYLWSSGHWMPDSLVSSHPFVHLSVLLYCW